MSLLDDLLGIAPMFLFESRKAETTVRRPQHANHIDITRHHAWMKDYSYLNFGDK
jgi:hypothetical protein